MTTSLLEVCGTYSFGNHSEHEPVGGTAGLTLANRLSANLTATILVLEAGGR